MRFFLASSEFFFDLFGEKIRLVKMLNFDIIEWIFIFIFENDQKNFDCKKSRREIFENLYIFFA